MYLRSIFLHEPVRVFIPCDITGAWDFPRGRWGPLVWGGISERFQAPAGWEHLWFGFVGFTQKYTINIPLGGTCRARMLSGDVVQEDVVPGLSYKTCALCCSPKTETEKASSPHSTPITWTPGSIKPHFQRNNCVCACRQVWFPACGNESFLPPVLAALTWMLHVGLWLAEHTADPKDLKPLSAWDTTVPDGLG